MRSKITEILNGFRKFLVSNAAIIQKMDKSGDGGEELNNWLQENWETRVENVVSEIVGKKVFLPVYGEGADRYGSSSRISNPDALPTHQIVVFSKAATSLDRFSGKSINPSTLSFDQFVDFTDGKYGHGPNFDFLLLNSSENEIFLLPGSEIEFDLIEQQ